MSHIPVNHHLRPLYRLLAALAGLYCLVFGIAGVAQNGGSELFDRGDHSVLGLRTNLAFAVLSIIVGAIVVVAAILGRNIDHFINLVAGAGYLVVGLVMMVLLQTDGNFLNFTMATVIVSYSIGVALLAAGLYGKTGTSEFERAEEKFRHGGH